MKPIKTTPSDYREMVEMFKGESDRGAAVLAGSYVENFLGIYLSSCMVDDSITDRLFGANGPLSTFANRIDFAHAFGFLPPALCADLHLVRKIRNHFAHHPLNASFSHSPVREWLASLVSSREINLGSGRAFKLEDPRTVYLISAGMLMVLAHNKIYGYGNPDV